jgi:16S rRNA pseudouridine516 synthase
MSKTQRLDKIISNMGYGTRKEIKQLVKQGFVKVNGTIVKDSSIHIDPENSLVEISGEILNYREFTYIMMNKPKEVISATYDDELITVIDILDERLIKQNLFPVGRLDIDTEGLLLITNDGQLTHKLLSPKKRVPKKYYAVIEGRVEPQDVLNFEEGIILDDGYKTLPSHLKILRTGEYSEVEVIIYEGKYHQIKRMFKAINKKVQYLKRLEMASLKLDSTLQPGEYRELTKEEADILLQYSPEN